MIWWLGLVMAVLICLSEKSLSLAVIVGILVLVLKNQNDRLQRLEKTQEENRSVSKDPASFASDQHLFSQSVPYQTTSLPEDDEDLFELGYRPPHQPPHQPAPLRPAPISSFDDTSPEPLTAAPSHATSVKSPWITLLEVDEQSPRVTSSILETVAAWFRGGNTIVRVGVLILFLGVAFLLRLVTEYVVVPIEFRLMGVALGGMVLFGLGWYLREQRRGYALSLQGGGMGVLYLVTFAALRLYGVLPAQLAFGVLVLLVFSTVVLALLQNALPLAVMAFSGGFLAPVLTSTGHGSHIALFSYYLVLNLGIAWIAKHQAWKLLNLVGFGFTFLIGTAWGLRSYEPHLYESTQFFLILHFALYLFICVQYSRHLIEAKDEARLRYVDGMLLFGLPIVAFGLQAAIVKHLPYGVALSSAVLAAIYLSLGGWLYQRMGNTLRFLCEGLLALGLIFFLLITPLALNARWTGAAWAVQGAGMLWIALRQQRQWAAALGLLLQLIAALSFWTVPREEILSLWANEHLLGAMLLGAGACVSAWLLRTHSFSADSELKKQESLLQWVMLMGGVAQVMMGLWMEWVRVDAPSLDMAFRICTLLLSFAVVLEIVCMRLQWHEPGMMSRGLLAGAIPISIAQLILGTRYRFFGECGWFEFLMVMVVGLWLQRRALKSTVNELKFLLGWYVLAQGAWQLYLLVECYVPLSEVLTPLSVVVMPILTGWWLTKRLMQSRWPMKDHTAVLTKGLLLPLLCLLGLWLLKINAEFDGGMGVLPYLPILNPVDLSHVLVLLYALTLYQAGLLESRTWVVLGGLLGFVWLNTMLVRTMYHWAGTPMWYQGALDNILVQTGMTILWALLALIIMFYATQRAVATIARGTWLVGATLLGMTVVKLLLIDLSNVGTLARIVSFIGVGVLMLIIGFVSPIPPSEPPSESATPKQE